MRQCLPAGIGPAGCLDAFKASYLWQHLPRPHDTTRAGLLPRSEARSAKIAQVLREAGMFDLGAFLGRLVEKQCAMEQVP